MIKKILWFLVGLLFLCFLLLNLFAYNQAYHFCHVDTEVKVRTKSENLLTWKEKLRLAYSGISNPKPENEYAPDFEHDTVFIQSNVKLEGWLSVSQHKNSPVVIMFPGYMAAKSYILRRAEILKNEEIDVLMMDFMGAGGSEGNVCTVGIREAVNVKDSYDYIRKQYPERKIYLFGNSMGAAAILKACRDYPEMKPDGLILECPFATLKQAIYNRCELLGIPAFPASELLMFWGGVQEDFSAFEMNPVEFARSVQAPVMLISGKLDQKVQSWETDSIFSALSAKDKKQVVLKSCGHDNFMREAGLWKKEVISFVK
ncbi:MAG: alpha/beta fold hydrolase [Bacteroidia bacterium]|nr:alpha/beta fold hydrolase [Bacteroidia bacterium]